MPSPRTLHGVLRDTADLYRLTPSQAKHIESELRTHLAPWPTLARRLSLPADTIQRLAAVSLPEGL